MSQLVFDEQAAAAIEAMYRIGDAERRRGLVRAALRAQPGERILDVGCGPGFYVAELLDEVGERGSVVGLDSSAPMLELARRRCAGRENVDFHEADAVGLPGGDADFDAALSVQVMEYVPDLESALAELSRVLRPGGRVLIWDIDWSTLSIQSMDEALTERVLRAWDEHLTHRSLPRTLARRLRAAGFESVGVQAHAFATPALDPETYGGSLVPFIAGFAGGRDSVSGEEAARWLAEQRELDERGEFFFAVTQFCFTGVKPPG
ncbi:MAG TPA: methyltransferase domain-containing protein [Thermoleophilaceae bacterium]|nr:methyltransferase domain-containing protein [Thermoleophilaceae bacterium]